jgi:hypothetical protein
MDDDGLRYIHAHMPDQRWDRMEVLEHNVGVLIARMEAVILAVKSLENRVDRLERATPWREPPKKGPRPGPAPRR